MVGRCIDKVLVQKEKELIGSDIDRALLPNKFVDVFPLLQNPGQNLKCFLPAKFLFNYDNQGN